MVKIFIPEIKRKHNKKLLARGFWANDKGKIFYDYVKIKDYTQVIKGVYYENLFYNFLNTIKASYKQEAIFYTENNQGYCYNGRDSIEALPNRIYQEVLRANLKHEIKEALRVYKGITIYQEAGRYYKEVYFK